MNLSAPFIRRPVGTTLLTVAVALAGAVGYFHLPVSALPQIDFPTVSVQAQLPGASAEIMASSVATPLERQFGRIAGVTEMTSSSTLGATTVTLQFDLDRNIDGAARDVQAAINAARSYLPANLPANPTYRKVNPADAPIMILSLTSPIYERGALYDSASTVIQQRLSQVQGVGQVNVGGSSLPAVRVEVNPAQLSAYGLGLPDVAGVLRSQNANLAKGQLTDALTSTDLATNDQLLKARDYQPLVIGYRAGQAIRLSDVAQVVDSTQNVRSSGYMNGQPAVLLIIFKAPGANIIDAVNRIRQALPQLQASIPRGIDMTVVLDRTTTIRASVADVERTLLISIGLVILVTFLFLRSLRATLIPSVVVPVSLIGTFGIMYLLGYSLDNLSLMALTISTGFVVDDAIVVIENITRSMEAGLGPMEASLQGAKEIGFTVLSISISLVAVFIPILMMGGIVGRLLREFAVTLSVAILMSLVISLTTTPMMCSRLLRRDKPEDHGRIYRLSEKFFDSLLDFYERTLSAVLRHPLSTLAVLFFTVAANICLVLIIPKGFFPEQDNGTVFGGMLGAQDISFQAMDQATVAFVDLIQSDPAVEHVMAFTGTNGATNTGFVYLGLKPLEQRGISASDLINRLRPKLMSRPGVGVFLQAGQDVRIGGRQSNAQYQYTLQSDTMDDLVRWGPLLYKEMKELPGFNDVNTDQQNNGLEASLTYDRSTAARVGITPQLLDTTLYDAFGQALVSTMFTPLNQYYVVMEAGPSFTQDPASLNQIYIHAPGGPVVPLSVLTHFETARSPLSVNHQGQFPSVTVSFNLAPGVALSQAADAIQALEGKLGMPPSVRGKFSGTLEAFQASLASEPILIVTALFAVYIVLGMLYESFLHPITILSTLPSAGVGAVFVLMLFGLDLSVVALIGIILLIGIVKKNAILMIDFALAAERVEAKPPRDAIFEACLLRFRPILMTTMAAIFGAIPLAFGRGMGSELRRPLGVAIIGGLVFSQMLTLYTTPVVYLCLDRLRLRLRKKRGPFAAVAASMLLVMMTGCTSVGPRYERPAVSVPMAYREAAPADWKTALPQDAAVRAKWWEMFDDGELNRLEGRVNVSNQNIAASFASFLQARSMVKQAASQFFPTVSVSPSVAVQGGQTPVSGVSSAAVSGNFGQYALPLDASWLPDLWGRVRNTIDANTASAQMSAADLENQRLAQQADLAIDYFELRSQDALVKLYDSSVEAYQATLNLTRSLYRTGINSDQAVAQAEAQLETARAQALNLGIARAQYEHAIAVLLGESASTFSLAPVPFKNRAPLIPPGVPSLLLERRPDIAAAERAMAAANAQIGVATAAYYPSLTLTGSGGVGGNSYSGLLAVPSFVWSLGSTLAETIFDGGARSAAVEQAQGAYQQAVANYRQAVLTAFQQVEDALAGLRILSLEIRQQGLAVEAAQRNLRIAIHLYRTGIQPYLYVLAAQVTLLTNQQTAQSLELQRLLTSVQLAEAVGGGWTRGGLPTPQDLAH